MADCLLQSWQKRVMIGSMPVKFHSSDRRAWPCRISAQMVRQERGFAGREYLERCLEAGGALHRASSSVFQQAVAAPPPASTAGEQTQLKRVVYQGNPGGYSHAVVEEAYGADLAEAIPCVEMEAVFKAVETWVADAALIPIQNNIDGSIHRNFDLLLRHQLHIVGELPWQVNHCLLAHPLASITTLRRVIGHPQALSHCRKALASLGLQPQEEEDTAHAVALIASSPDIALVASSQAAHVFGLQVIGSGIQDDVQNMTRFLQLERQPMPAPRSPDVACKTIVAFALPHGPRDLCRVMSAFAHRDIRVTNLESRPASASIKQMMGEQIEETARAQFKYVFVVDIEGSTSRQDTLKALRQVRELCSFYRVLGSYALLAS